MLLFISRVALQFVHEMQQKSQKNFDASRERERVLPVFGVGVAYIDETAIHPVPSDDFDKAIDDMEFVVSSLAPPEKQFLVVPTESIYSRDLAAGKDRLTKLVNAITDVTGKQDLLKHLRMLCLQKVRLSITSLIRHIRITFKFVDSLCRLRL